MEQHKLDRINELSRISRERELTPEEQAERQLLRDAYRLAFREQFKQQLDNTIVEFPDGTRKPLSESAPDK